MVYNPALNPFGSEEGAKNWIDTVERGDGFREQFIYPRVREWMGTLDPYSVLVDDGCGQGKCSEFAPDSMTYIGFDPAEPLISRAQELYGDSDNRHFFVGSAEQIELPDASVDAALSVHVWFHLEDPLPASRELGRIVRPGGQLYITTANPKGYDVWRRWYKNVQEGDGFFRGTLVGPDFQIDDSVVFTHTMDRILDALTDAGFTVIATEDFGREDVPTALGIRATKSSGFDVTIEKM